jgi:hypothetical protein
MLAITRWLIEQMPNVQTGHARPMPPARRSPDAIRSARYRARRQNGHAVFHVEADRDALIIALLASGRLTEAQALDHARVERELTVGRRERKRRAT